MDSKDQTIRQLKTLIELKFYARRWHRTNPKNWKLGSLSAYRNDWHDACWALRKELHALISAIRLLEQSK